MARVTPISDQYSAAVNYFNNLSTAGDSLAGVDYSTGLRAPELAASIEDALLLSLL
ncbi:MAG TPA: hypothetical protein VK615_05285 [Candidatus Binatia bacterium]|nr:hypothetical protein [Candidatus Binatia bacterium]